METRPAAAAGRVGPCEARRPCALLSARFCLRLRGSWKYFPDPSLIFGFAVFLALTLNWADFKEHLESRLISEMPSLSAELAVHLWK